MVRRQVLSRSQFLQRMLKPHRSPRKVARPISTLAAPCQRHALPQQLRNTQHSMITPHTRTTRSEQHIVVWLSYFHIFCTETLIAICDFRKSKALPLLQHPIGTSRHLFLPYDLQLNQLLLRAAPVETSVSSAMPTISQAKSNLSLGECCPSSVPSRPVQTWSFAKQSCWRET